MPTPGVFEAAKQNSPVANDTSSGDVVDMRIVHL